MTIEADIPVGETSCPVTMDLERMDKITPGEENFPSGPILWTNRLERYQVSNKSDVTEF